MQLALSAFSLYSLFVYVNVMRADHIFSLMFMKMPTGKRLKSQTKKVVANSTGVIGLKDLLNKQLMAQ